MTDTDIAQLKQMAELKHCTYDPDVVTALIARLEAAEQERDSARALGPRRIRIEAAERERDAAIARAEAAEAQLAEVRAERDDLQALYERNVPAGIPALAFKRGPACVRCGDAGRVEFGADDAYVDCPVCKSTRTKEPQK